MDSLTQKSSKIKYPQMELTMLRLQGELPCAYRESSRSKGCDLKSVSEICKKYSITLF